MGVLLDPIFELLPLYGPWVLFGLSLAETSFLWGLIVPAGVSLSVSTVLALEGGEAALAPMIMAYLAGGAVGDSVGFWLGRWSGEQVLASDSRWARKMRRRHLDIEAVFGRHPVYSVSFARVIAFVRTVMPLAAGMSGMAYPRYLPYQLAGLVGSASLYVGIGYTARESWEVATRVVGAGTAVLFVIVGLVVWKVVRRERRRAAGPREKADA